MMWHRIARLWGCPIGEAKRRMPAREFSEWEASYALEPWGDERADWRSARQTADLLNGSPWRAKARPVQVRDVLLKFERPHMVQTARESHLTPEQIGRLNRARMNTIFGAMKRGDAWNTERIPDSPPDATPTGIAQG